MSKYAIEIYNLSKRYRLIDAGSGESNTSFLDYLLFPLKRFKEIQSLTKFKKGEDEKDIFWALRNINLNIEEGDVVGIIGKNGAGKSVLLKILSKITAPTTGKVILRGRVNSLLEVGTGFNPDLTGRENIYMNGTLHGMTKKEITSKFDEIVDFAGVEKFIDIPVKRYSSGMGVRLGFAVAAHLEPEILLIDEVLAVGDFIFQKKAIEKMQNVSKIEGRTVLFVSHNMTTVAGLCNKVALIENGSISKFGTPDEVIPSFLLKSRENIGTFDLTERNDYSGSGVLKIGKFLINNKSNFKVLNANNIKFSFEVLNPSKIKGQLEFCGFISDCNAQYLHFFSSTLKGKYYIVNEENINVSFSLMNLPLQIGKYYIQLELKLNKEVVYILENAFYIDVEDNNFYKMGINWFEAPGHMLIEQEWY